jgi:hypothetical protein
MRTDTFPYKMKVERVQLKDLDKDGRMVLKCIINTWTGLIWNRITIGNGLLNIVKTFNEPSGFIRGDEFYGRLSVCCRHPSTAVYGL